MAVRLLLEEALLVYLRPVVALPAGLPRGWPMCKLHLDTMCLVSSTIPGCPDASKCMQKLYLYGGTPALRFCACDPATLAHRYEAL